jgi:peptide/nickel transport system substrate-binding protein
MKSPLKIVGFTLYFVLLVVVCGKLFFETQFNVAVNFLIPAQKQTEKTLTIGYADPLLNLSPLANDTGSRSRLLHVYEALTSVTPDLQIKPGLAIAYGSLDPNTWEFRLRPDVVFQNGDPLTIEDVIFSLEKAKKAPDSGVKDLSSTIKEVKKIDSETFYIITVQPDPLLPNKLSSLFIFSKKSDDGIPFGTGPYVISKNDNGSLELDRFSAYWGDKPNFNKIVLKTLSSKQEKINALSNGSVDILANLPADLAGNFEFKSFNLKTRPSLEVNFLMFNFDGVFKSHNAREAVSLALRTDQLARLAQGFAVPVSQFVSDGIFGYDPSITKIESDTTRALELVPSGLKTTLDLPKGLEVFGENVVAQLKAVGIDVTVNYISPQELGKKITAQASDFYFFGWRTDLGDASDFLTAVAHSRVGNFGQFNGSDYENPEVDRLIELSQTTVSQTERLNYLRAAMKKITVDDIIGVPLFSPEVLYGVSNGIEFSPRVDGYVLAQEVKM